MPPRPSREAAVVAPLVKVCGVTSARDAEACVEAGADWVGVNFIEGSPRRVTIEVAVRIGRALRGRAELVGLTTLGPPASLAELRRDAGLDRLQLYPGDVGSGSDGALRACDVCVARVRDALDVERALAMPGELIIVDARVEGALGGTGQRVPVELARAVAKARAVVLAGGLDAENVAQAIMAVEPAGVDVSSGVELSPGVKDHGAVASFIERARAAFADVARRAAAERPE